MAMLDGDGEVVDFLRLKHLMKRKNSVRVADKEAKVLLHVEPEFRTKIPERQSKLSTFDRPQLIAHWADLKIYENPKTIKNVIVACQKWIVLFGMSLRCL